MCSDIGQSKRVISDHHGGCFWKDWPKHCYRRLQIYGHLGALCGTEGEKTPQDWEWEFLGWVACLRVLTSSPLIQELGKIILSLWTSVSPQIRWRWRCWSTQDQGFSGFSVLSNHLEVWLKARSLAAPPKCLIQQVWGGDPWLCPCNTLPDDADATGPETTFWEPLIQRLSKTHSQLWTQHLFKWWNLWAWLWKSHGCSCGTALCRSRGPGNPAWKHAEDPWGIVGYWACHDVLLRCSPKRDKCRAEWWRARLSLGPSPKHLCGLGQVAKGLLASVVLTYKNRTVMVLTWPSIKKMLDKWLLLLELTIFYYWPFSVGRSTSENNGLHFHSVSHAPPALTPPSLDSQLLMLTPSQNPKQVMRKIQYNLLNNSRGFLQGTLTTLNTIN